MVGARTNLGSLRKALMVCFPGRSPENTTWTPNEFDEELAAGAGSSLDITRLLQVALKGRTW
jgi:hypothetical protein